MLLGFCWTPTRQVIEVDGVLYAHDGEIPTNPSHDFAHLLVAAAGIAWHPKGTHEEVSQAEFNAVLVENLCLHAADGWDALEPSLERARWFWEKHWRDSPYSFEEALACFAAADPEPIVRLAPGFVELRDFETLEPDYRQRAFWMRFNDDITPTGGPDSFRELLESALNRLCSAEAVVRG